uniref:Aminopeptidase n=1 Tax=Sphaeramia orbicularis TaxID=375764 RepID=A0A672YRJ4_9TELE
MGKVYYVSKNVGLGVLMLGTLALAIIIALSIAYDKERAKNRSKPGDGVTDSTSMPILPTTPSAPKETWDHYRLPDSFIPISYAVTLWPRLVPNDDGMYIFTGHSTVVFRCVKETNLILIHSNKLNLTIFNEQLAKLSALGEHTAPAIAKSWLVSKTQYLVLQLRKSLTVGRSYILYTEFQGELADDLEGFYRSEYVEDGVKKIVATSQMQATFARKTFPCFDEPAMKAVFNVTIIHDRGTIALSNGKEMGTADSLIDGIAIRITTFEPTERMSTYLLAFIVCDFILKSQQENLKAIDDRQGEYALNVTGPILHFYEQYYNARYPLSKSDQIALPDFNAGAMENWGLVTYRETALLYDPSYPQQETKRELLLSSHMNLLTWYWFGNLVTLRWWNDLWLNEGFASYVEYLGADYAEPTWDMKDQIILYDVHKVFAVDALASSHPLSCLEDEVNTPAQISEMFNTISYSKGAAVLRMLSEFLSEPVFARGLSSYLNTFAFGNTVYTDLWDHLQQAVDNTPGLHIPHSVHDIMHRWTLQMGFPVVTINTQSGSITQKHFLLDPDSVVERPSQFNYTWFVPIKWLKTGVEQQQYWLLHKTDVNSQMTTSGSDWVLANTNVSGYFRVNYDLENWDRLLSLLNTNHKALSVINRAQIIDDAFNLARAKIINTTLALRTTKYLSNERDYIPWESALRNLNYYILMFDRTEVYGALQAYMKKQIQPLFEHFRSITSNWTKVPEGHTDQYNQINAIGVACSMDVEGCRELTKSWFRQWMQNPMHNPIHPNLKSTVYCNAIAFGGTEEWDFAWKMFKNATLASEASRLRGSLACTKTPWLLNRYPLNVVGMPLAWNFVRERWSTFLSMEGDHFSFSSLIKWNHEEISTEFELQEIQRRNQHVGFGSATMAMGTGYREDLRPILNGVTENKVQVLKWFTEEST